MRTISQAHKIKSILRDKHNLSIRSRSRTNRTIARLDLIDSKVELQTHRQIDIKTRAAVILEWIYIDVSYVDFHFQAIAFFT